MGEKVKELHGNNDKNIGRGEGGGKRRSRDGLPRL